MSKFEISVWRWAVWWARGQDFQLPKRYRPGFTAFVDLWHGELIDNDN